MYYHMWSIVHSDDITSPVATHTNIPNDVYAMFSDDACCDTVQEVNTMTILLVRYYCNWGGFIYTNDLSIA